MGHVAVEQVDRKVGQAEVAVQEMKGGAVVEGAWSTLNIMLE